MTQRGESRVRVEPGIELFVQDLGQGRPVVLLPGFGLNHEVWDAQVRRLAGAGHRSVCIDLRGTGLSDKPLGGYGMERLGADVATVIEQLDLRGATLVGWSFGGQVAFRAAATLADRVSQLVLIASNGVRASRSDAYPFGRPPEDSEAALIGAEKSNRPVARRETIAAAFHRKPDPGMLDWLVRCSLQMPSWAAIPCYRSMLRADLLADLPSVTMPVLQVYGDSDPAISAGGARWLNEQLAEASIVEIHESGHFPMFEAAEEFDGALLRFVREGPGA